MTWERAGRLAWIARRPRHLVGWLFCGVGVPTHVSLWLRGGSR